MDAHEHGHEHTEDAATMFEAPSWDERYSGEQTVWSGNPNAQLVAEASGLAPGRHSTSAAARAAT